MFEFAAKFFERKQAKGVTLDEARQTMKDAGVPIVPGIEEGITDPDIAAEIAQNFHGTPVYPASLDLPDQALFSVGYYHQLHFFSSLSAAKRADSAPAAKTAPTAASAA